MLPLVPLLASLLLAQGPVLDLPDDVVDPATGGLVDDSAHDGGDGKERNNNGDGDGDGDDDDDGANTTDGATGGYTLPTLPGLGLGLDVTEDELMKGLQAARLRAGRTLLGGYAQLNVNALSTGPGDDGGALNDFATQATVRRLVVFIAHTFNEDLRFYTELEWEHAIACRTCVGAVEIEQAFLEWDLLKDRSKAPLMTLRTGLVLVPIGILNQWHEPPVFHGVDRARLEEGLIPSTWRELGAGIVGELTPGLNYELYLTTGLDPLRFQPGAFGGGRGNGGQVNLDSMMLSGRLELEPFLGFLVGVSGIYGETGGMPFTPERFADNLGDPLRLTLPLATIEADARVRRNGFEARTLVVSMHFPNAGDLQAAKRLDGSPTIVLPDATKGAIPTWMVGAQLEVAYDVFHPFDFTEQQLLPFVRVEFIDMQAAVPDGFVGDATLRTKELTVGLSYRPIQQVVLKVDGQLRNRQLGPDEVQLNLGLGLMF